MREYPSLRARLQAILLLFAALFLGLAFYQYHTARTLFFSALEKDLRADLMQLAERFGREPRLLQGTATDSLCKAISAYKGFRITVTDSTGRVIGDSHVAYEKLSEVENHRWRPEFEAAARGEFGIAQRYSNTIHLDMVYVAHKLPQGEYLRIAAGPPALKSFQKAALTELTLFLLLFLMTAGYTTWWVWRRISAPLLRLQAEARDPSKPLRWDARFREAEVLNQAFQAYVGEIQRLAGDVRKERDRLVEVINRLEEGVLLLGPEGVMKALNPSAIKLLGHTPSGESINPWIGRPFSELAPVPALIEFAAAAGNPERPPVLLLDKNETQARDLLCHLRPLSGDGTHREWLLTVMDVTQFRQLDRMKSEFVANASHELKTPLASIRGYSEALAEGAIHDEKRREGFVKKILANALRLEALIGDLLALSRLEGEKQIRETEPLPLRAFVNRSLELHRAGIDSAGIRVENYVPEEVVVQMDPRDLELILNNLIGNAVKYNRAAGKVKVSWEIQDDGGGRLGVKDTGLGIPQDMLPRIFERFYRADASRARQEGTGLGLAIVKHAAQKYGLTVQAESEMGEGSRFSVDFPRHRLEAKGP